MGNAKSVAGVVVFTIVDGMDQSFCTRVFGKEFSLLDRATIKEGKKKSYNIEQFRNQSSVSKAFKARSWIIEKFCQAETLTLLRRRALFSRRSIAALGHLARAYHRGIKALQEVP
jgi:hypothetical protein